MLRTRRLALNLVAAAVLPLILLSACGSPSSDSPSSVSAGTQPFEEVALSASAATDIVPLADSGLFAVVDGVGERTDGTRGPVVTVEQSDGALTRWDVGDGTPLIYPVGWVEDTELFVKAVQCAKPSLEILDSADSVPQACGSMGKVIVLKVDLSTGNSEVIIDELPADGDGSVVYVPGTEFDLAAVAADLEGQEVYAVDRATGTVTLLGRAAGLPATTCFNGSSFIRMAESDGSDIVIGPAGTIQLGPEGEATAENPDPNLVPVPESGTVGPVELVQQINRTEISGVPIPESLLEVNPVLALGCGRDGSIVVSESVTGEVLALTVAPDRTLSIAELPGAAPTNDPTATVHTTDEGSLFAYKTQESEQQMELLVLIDDTWLNFGPAGQDDPPFKIAISGKRVAFETVAKESVTVEVRSA